MKRILLACGLLLAGLFAQPVLSVASAQEPAAKAERKASSRGKRAKKPKRGKQAQEEPKAAAPEVKPSDKDKDKEASVPGGESVAPPVDSKASSSSALAGGEEAVRKEGDTDVKTVEFTGLDIEGQLKTPQLLYFLTRLRAEFDRPRLPHRSFMPELSRSTGEKSLR